MKRFLPLLAVPALLLAGCGSGNKTTATPAPGTTSPSATASATTAAAAPSTGGGSSSGTGSGAGTGSGTGTKRCHTADLTVKAGASDGATGTFHTNLVFTDKSGHSCTLYGYPGVSWVAGDNGAQVNDPFQRAGGTRRTITLAPGGQAHTVLITHNALNYPEDQCKPVDVRGYRVYPPDETAAIFVSAPGKACSVKGTNLGQVEAIAAGPGRAGE